jgi:hypothetical protein
MRRKIPTKEKRQRKKIASEPSDQHLRELEEFPPKNEEV